MIAGFEDFCVQRRAPARPDILYITTTGMAVWYLVRDKLESLRAAGYRIRVLCGEDSYAARLAEEGLPVDTIKLSRFFRPLGDCGAFIRLVRYLRRVRPRIVHSSTPKAGLLAPIAARLAGIPAVHTVAGLMFHDRAFRQENFLYRPAERVTAASASYLLFQSREDLERIRNLGWKHSERLVYLGNGVDTGRFNPDLYRSERSAIRREWGYGDDQFLVGIVARLLRSKGLGEFLEVANKLRGLPQLRFLVVGPAEANHAGAISDELVRRAVEAGNVRFLGERQDMPGVYAAMDLFVLPSYREGVARALMEASAMELPVISSDIRGCREVVEDGRTGWLVPVRDRDALVERILECWRSPAQARQFGRAGRERIQLHFNAQTVTSRLLQFYGQLLGQPVRTVPGTVQEAVPAILSPG